MTDSDWNQFPNFDRWEFDCKCRRCRVDGNLMEVDFLRRLQRARTRAGTGFTINSAMRCAQHNADVGGVSSSTHLRGWAADIACRGNEHRALILEALFEAGFRRLGLASTFIHVDCDPALPTPRIWFY